MCLIFHLIQAEYTSSNQFPVLCLVQCWCAMCHKEAKTNSSRSCQLWCHTPLVFHLIQTEYTPSNQSPAFCLVQCWCAVKSTKTNFICYSSVIGINSSHACVLYNSYTFKCIYDTVSPIQSWCDFCDLTLEKKCSGFFRKYLFVKRKKVPPDFCD